MDKVAMKMLNDRVQLAVPMTLVTMFSTRRVRCSLSITMPRRRQRWKKKKRFTALGCMDINEIVVPPLYQRKMESVEEVAELLKEMDIGVGAGGSWSGGIQRLFFSHFPRVGAMEYFFW